MAQVMSTTTHTGRPAVPTGSMFKGSGKNHAGQLWERFYTRRTNETYLIVRTSPVRWVRYVYSGNVVPSCCG